MGRFRIGLGWVEIELWFRIGCLGCAVCGFKAGLVRFGWLRVGEGWVLGAFRV